MLLYSLEISLICIAVHIILTWKGMLLKPVGDWLDLRLNKYIKKPLFTCPMCMASFWTLMFWLYFDLRFSDIIIYTMLIVCGINTILYAFIYALHEEEEDFTPITNELDTYHYEAVLTSILYPKGAYTPTPKLTPEEKEKVRKIKKLLNDYYLEKFIESLV